MSIPHSPAGFKREMRFLEVWKFAGVLIPRMLRKQVRPVFARGNAGFGDCGRGRSSGVRVCAPSRWRLSMRRSRGERPTTAASARRPYHGRDKLSQCLMFPRQVSGLMSHVRAPTPASPAACTLAAAPRRCFRPKSQKSRTAAIDDHAIRAKGSLQSPAQQASCQTDRCGARAALTPFEHAQN